MFFVFFLFLEMESDHFITKNWQLTNLKVIIMIHHLKSKSDSEINIFYLEANRENPETPKSAMKVIRKHNLSHGLTQKQM